MAERTGASACTTSPFYYFPSRLLRSLCLFNAAMILLCHIRLMRGQAMERRPTPRPCAQDGRSPSLPECLSTFHSSFIAPVDRSLACTSPTGPTLYGHTWLFRRLRVEITCKCLVTVPSFFSFRECSHLWSSENPFHFGKWLIPATHPTMLSYIGLDLAPIPRPRFYGRDLGVTASDISPSWKS
jgi:hypothetical protein